MAEIMIMAAATKKRINKRRISNGVMASWRNGMAAAMAWHGWQ